MAGKKRQRKVKLKKKLKFEAYGIILLLLFIFELANWGIVGFTLNSFFRLLIGVWDFIISILGITLALHLMIKQKFEFTWTMRKTGAFLFFIALISNTHFDFVDKKQLNGQFTDTNVFSLTWQELHLEMTKHTVENVGGGMIGTVFYYLFDFLFGNGANIFIVSLFLIGLLLIFHFSYIEFFKKGKNLFRRILTFLQEKGMAAIELLAENRKAKSTNSRLSKNNHTYEPNEMPFAFDEENEAIPIIHDFLDRTAIQNNHVESEENHQASPLQPSKNVVLKKRETQHPLSENTEEIELNGVTLQKVMEEEENYRLPPYSLLDHPLGFEQGNDLKDISNNAKKLEATLDSFGVKAKVLQIHRGPAVTRYEIQPDTGVKVSRIVSLADDIALSLAAKDIRIEAPIPGKAAIGIEVPNSEVAIVTLREVLESKQFFDSKSILSIALGRDITGEPIIGNLGKMPHLLVAGATGSGKSVCINSIVSSLLYKAKPSEVKLLMIDPKMVELNVYNGIPHLISPVVTDPKKAAKALKMIVNEMEKRYEKFSEKGARDIERYNTLLKAKEESEEQNQIQLLPYIVVIIDELADLMMVAPTDVEDAIIRLAQKARAAGIHLIVATQRPSVDVITGLIKANIPSRIAFGVSSQIDSRTILDMGGAEKLLGRGDMLYLPVGSSKPTRIQGAFISEQEVEAVVSFVKNQQEANYQQEIINNLNQPTNEKEENEDELFFEAVQIVVENKQASVSLLQRRLRVGYARAARLIDSMEARGIVGPYEGSKPRAVLISENEFEEIRVSI